MTVNSDSNALATLQSEHQEALRRLDAAHSAVTALQSRATSGEPVTATELNEARLEVELATLAEKGASERLGSAEVAVVEDDLSRRRAESLRAVQAAAPRTDAAVIAALAALRELVEAARVEGALLEEVTSAWDPVWSFGGDVSVSSLRAEEFAETAVYTAVGPALNATARWRDECNLRRINSRNDLDPDRVTRHHQYTGVNPFRLATMSAAEVERASLENRAAE